MSTHTRTAFEHDRLDYHWTERDLRAIDRINAAAGPVLQAGADHRGRYLRTNSYVGLLHLDRLSLQILPKLYDPRHAAADSPAVQHAATVNFLTMLAYAADIPVYEQGLAQLQTRADDWFELLTGLFARHLIDLWSRGHHRTYRTLDQTLPTLKGRWRLDEQLRRPGNNHHFAVRFDEFTGDNALNRLLRFVVERLWRTTRHAANRRNLSLLRHWMDQVTLLPSVTLADARQLHLTRLNQHYRPVVNLARLFLGHNAFQLTAGDTAAYSFLFDMNVLFEGFIIGLIQRHRRRILGPELAACRLLPQSHGDAHHAARSLDDHRPLFALHPDLVLRAGDAYPLLLDTKYKRLNPAERRLGVSPADLYQMAAYAQAYAAPRIILLYPQTADMPAALHRAFGLNGSDTRVEVHTVDLHADLSRPAALDRLIDSLHSILAQEEPDHGPH